MVQTYSTHTHAAFIQYTFDCKLSKWSVYRGYECVFARALFPSRALSRAVSLALPASYTLAAVGFHHEIGLLQRCTVEPIYILMSPVMVYLLLFLFY